MLVPPPVDANRRTHLANERTFLAWWRPEGRSWPYPVVGAGYAVLLVLVIASP
jgi:hypothetical protein